MNVLVLGGSRQIGLHLVRLLHSQGHTVTVLNRGQTQVSLPTDVNKIIADRSVAEQVKTVLDGRGYDTVFDISGYRPSEIEPVLDALEGNVRHYVFCSTVAVYSPKINAMPIFEDSPLNRHQDADDYSREKILCEDLLVERFNRSGFPVTIVRPPYVYGPHDQLERRIFSIFARLSLGRKLIAPGEGHALTHTVHVDDLTSAFAAISGRADVLGQVFNVAGLEAVTFNDYVDLIAKIMGVEPQLVRVSVTDYEEMLEALTPIYSHEICDLGWKESVIYSTEGIRTQLPWLPKYDISSGIEMTYKWWLDQKLDREPWYWSADERALAWFETRQR